MINIHEYELMYKEMNNGQFMPVIKLKLLGKRGYELFCVEKETWRRTGGIDEKKKEHKHTSFRYCFVRHKNWEQNKTKFDYKEVVLWHDIYKDDALNYFTRGWVNVASFTHLKEKESGIIEDGVVSTVMCPCHVYYYKRETNDIN